MTSGEEIFRKTDMKYIFRILRHIPAVFRAVEWQDQTLHNSYKELDTGMRGRGPTKSDIKDLDIKDTYLTISKLGGGGFHFTTAHKDRARRKKEDSEPQRKP